MLELELMFM